MFGVGEPSARSPHARIRHKRVRFHFPQLEAWYLTLDQLEAAKEKIEVTLYHRQE
jgi:hypothetical protein